MNSSLAESKPFLAVIWFHSVHVPYISPMAFRQQYSKYVAHPCTHAHVAPHRPRQRVPHHSNTLGLYVPPPPPPLPLEACVPGSPAGRWHRAARATRYDANEVDYYGALTAMDAQVCVLTNVLTNVLPACCPRAHRASWPRAGRCGRLHLLHGTRLRPRGGRVLTTDHALAFLWTS